MVLGLGRVRARLLLLTLAAVVLALLPVATHPARADDPSGSGPTYTFSSSGVDGAGFINVIARSPFQDGNGARPLVVGGDVSGIERSEDGGVTWQASNTGLNGANSWRVGAVAFSPDVPGLMAACSNAGVATSTDFGRTWTPRAGSPICDGNGSPATHVNGQAHPRATGSLLAFTGAGSSSLWLGSVKTGIRRSDDGGATWAVSALGGSQIRSLVVDPTDPDNVYAAVKGGGIVSSTNGTTASPTFTRMPGSPDAVEEIADIGGQLYAAANTSGILRLQDGAWKSAGSLPAGRWEAIAGGGSGDGVVLYAGAAGAAKGQGLQKSTDGGASWQPLTTAVSTEYGTDAPWWAAGIAYLAFGGGAFVTSQLLVDDNDAGHVWLAGRAGLWATDNGGATWAPADRGLSATVLNDVVADPKMPGRAYVALWDWTFLASADDLADVRKSVPKGAANVGYRIALDQSGPTGRPSPVYLATQQRKGGGGAEIYLSPDPLAASPTWTAQGFRKAAGGHSASALAIGRDAKGGAVLLARADHRGMYRKAGGKWTRVTASKKSAPPFLGTGVGGALAWAPGTTTVYALDPAHGLFRSTDAGLTWRNLLSVASPTASGRLLAVDPTAPNSVLIATSGPVAGSAAGLWYVTVPASGPVATTRLADDPVPGPVAIGSDGTRFALVRGPGAALLVAPPGANTATTATTPGLHGCCTLPNGLAVSATGLLLESSTAAGASVGVRGTVPVAP
jgi:hypothetical protein